MWKKIADIFHKVGAISPETAVTLSDLKFPEQFKKIINSPMGEILPIIEYNSKYYLDVKKVEELQRSEDKILKHTASVPQGYLRYLIPFILKSGPMNGSEIVQRIYKTTHGKWKPSSGSIYPLLKSLKEQGYITEKKVSNDKRSKYYVLTDLGLSLTNQKTDYNNQIVSKFNNLYFLDILQSLQQDVYNPQLDSLRKKLENLLKILLTLRNLYRELISTDLLEKIESILDNTINGLEKIFNEYASSDTKKKGVNNG